MIVNSTGLAGDMIGEYDDGLQAGLGMKLWLTEKPALRGLLDFEYNGVTSTTTFGLSAAYEYHLLQRRVSPYLGGLAGLRLESAAANDFAFYFGGILGAAVRAGREPQPVRGVQPAVHDRRTGLLRRSGAGQQHRCWNHRLPGLTEAASARRTLKNTKHPLRHSDNIRRGECR